MPKMKPAISNPIPKNEYKRLGETVDSLSDEALLSLGLDKKYIKNGKPNREAIQAAVSDGVIGPLTKAIYDISKRPAMSESPYLPTAIDKQAVNAFSMGMNGVPFTNNLLKTEAPTINPQRVDAVNPVTPKTNYDGLLSDATSGLRALGASYMAKDGLPSWRPTDDYYKNYGDIKTRSNMGLSAEAKTYAEGMRNRAFSAGAAQIGSLAGGGSSAAALGALSGLNESRFDSVNRSMLMDEAQRTLNQDKFTQAVGQDQNIDRMMFQDQYQQDMYKQQAANAAVAANLQNIQERRDFEQSYGPNSTYQKMMDARLQETQLKNIAYAKYLKDNGVN